jgi:hypothetical protein
MPKFIVRINGSIEVEAADRNAAQKVAAADNARAGGAYCGYDAREVGKDCDANGWDLPRNPMVAPEETEVEAPDHDPRLDQHDTIDEWCGRR